MSWARHRRAPTGSIITLIAVDEILEEITEIGSLEDMIQDLIEWSKANGRTEELLRKARAHNPTDPLLQAVYQKIL